MKAVATTTRVEIDIIDLDKVVAVIVVVGHALEQGRLAMRTMVMVMAMVMTTVRRWRGVVALPCPPNPDLRVFLIPDAASASTNTSTRARTALALALPATTSAISHVPRALEPVAGVVPLTLPELERALLHPQSIIVARALADVYRGARAPAVAKGVAVFPVAWRAGTCRRRGGI